MELPESLRRHFVIDMNDEELSLSGSSVVCVLRIYNDFVITSISAITEPEIQPG